MHCFSFLWLKPWRPLQPALVVGMVVALSLLGGGCAVSMATKQPDKKDLSVLRPRVSRSRLIAELGQPTLSERRQGKRVEVFAFRQGYSRAAKTGRALAHGVADVLTVGLWEVIGIPTETYFSGTAVHVEITYDTDDTVSEVLVLEGDDVIPAQHYDNEVAPPSKAAATTRSRSQRITQPVP